MAAALTSCAYADPTDLADGASWPGGVIPADAVIENGATYTASSNLTFNTFVINGDSSVFDMRESASGGANRRIAVTKPSLSGDKYENGDSFYLGAGASGTVQTFRGGIWDFNGAHFGLSAGKVTGALGDALGAQIILENGCVVTNVATLAIGPKVANPNGSTLTVRGSGTMLHLKKGAGYDGSNFNISYPTVGSKGKLEILDGAGFYSAVPCYADDYSSGSPNDSECRFVASGEGTRATFTGLYLGWGYNYNTRFLFDDHAKGFFSGAFCVGYGSNYSKGTNAVFTISGGAEVVSLGKVELGLTSSKSVGEHSCDNRIEVLDGGLLIASNSVVISCGSAAYSKAQYGIGDATHDNGIIVSNATLRLAGAGDNGYCYVGSAPYTYNNYLRLIDGAELSGGSVALGRNGTNAWNRVEAHNAQISISDLYVGYAVASYSNRVEISDSTANFNAITVGRAEAAVDNEFTVSNSTCDVRYFNMFGVRSTATFADTEFAPFSLALGSNQIFAHAPKITLRGARSFFKPNLTSKSFTWGSATSDNAELAIEDGAALDFGTGTNLYVGVNGATGSRVRVRNAKLTAMTVQIVGGNGSLLELSGPDTEFALLRKTDGNFDLFGSGGNGSVASNCVYRITDGAQITYLQNIYFSFHGNVCHDNTLAVDDHAVLNMNGNTLNFGYSNRDIEKHYHNTVYVGNGGVITNLNRMTTGACNDDHLVVDNGAIYPRSLGYGTTTSVHTNTVVLIKGKNPVLAATEFVTLTMPAIRLRFEVPAGGFGGTVLRAGTSMTIGGEGAEMSIDLSACIADMPKEGERVISTLMQAKDALTIDPGVLATAQASVAEQLAEANLHGKLALSADGKSLVLTAYRPTGLILKVR